MFHGLGRRLAAVGTEWCCCIVGAVDMVGAGVAGSDRRTRAVKDNAGSDHRIAVAVQPVSIIISKIMTCW